jgi:hypothetical protein
MAGLLIWALAGGSSIWLSGTPISNGVGSPHTFRITGEVEGLMRGVPVDLPVVVRNDHNFPIEVTSLTVAVHNDPATPGCPSSMVRPTSFTGSIVIPTQASRSVSGVLSLTMISTAPSDCDRATFPLKFGGHAKKPGQKP